MKANCEFAARHKHLRKQLGLSLDDVAKSAGMSKSGVWEIESGRTDPRLSTVRKLAAALGVEVKELLSDGDLSPSLTTRELRVLHAMRGGYD